MQTKQTSVWLSLLCALTMTGLLGCKKKSKISPLCVKVHAKVLSLIQSELKALPKGKSATAAQQKHHKRLSKLSKILASKRGKERSILKCSKSAKSKKHSCALQAKSTQDVKRCYLLPNKTKKAPQIRKTLHKQSKQKPSKSKSKAEKK